MNTFWVHKNWKWKKENATAKYIDAQCEEAVTLSDAQATIAALEETILKMGENAAVVAKDAMAAKEQIAALQAERDEYKTMYACLTGETYDNPIADLKAQLTQRTAELEAVNKHQQLHDRIFVRQRDLMAHYVATIREAIRRLGNSTHSKEQPEPYESRTPVIAAFLGQALGVTAEEAERERADLQAELERVSALVKALPKVEGEIEVSSGVYNFILLKHDSGTRFLCGQIETEQTAQAIAALWEHRQGMEG